MFDDDISEAALHIDTDLALGSEFDFDFDVDALEEDIRSWNNRPSASGGWTLSRASWVLSRLSIVVSVKQSWVLAVILVSMRSL